jgi:hypothetical protein
MMPLLGAYFAEFDGIWANEQPPIPEEERALMGRYGMEPV